MSVIPSVAGNSQSTSSCRSLSMSYGTPPQIGLQMLEYIDALSSTFRYLLWLKYKARERFEMLTGCCLLKIQGCETQGHYHNQSCRLAGHSTRCHYLPVQQGR